MVLVRMDVPAARDAASRLSALSALIQSRARGVEDAVERAQASVFPALAGVPLWVSMYETAAGDLRARVDLAVLVNGGDENALNSNTVEYDVPSDDGTSTRIALAHRMAEIGRDVEGREQDPADLARIGQLQALMERYATDSTVMRTMYTDLGPDGVIELTVDVGAVGFDRIREGASTLPALHLLHQGLETATRAMGQDDARAFGRGLADATVMGFVLNRTSAFTFLTYDSEMNAFALMGAADRIGEAERDGPLHPGYWQNATSGRPSFNLLGAAFPDGALTNDYLDPMEGVFDSLAKDPAMVLDYFTDESVGGARMSFWLQQRDWGVDSFETIGRIVDEAATDPAILGGGIESQQNASLLASGAVHHLSKNEAFGLNDGDWGGTGASENLAHLLAVYMPGVDVASRLASPNVTPPATAAYLSDALGRNLPMTPVFDIAAVQELVGVVARDDDAFEMLRGGVSGYQQQLLAEAVHCVTPPDHSSKVSDVLLESARIEGLFAHAVGAGSIEDAAYDDARAQAWVDLATGVVGAVPVPGGPVVGFLAEQAIGQVSGSVGDAVTTAEARANLGAEGMAKRSEQQFRITAMQALAQSGALPGQHGGDRLQNGPGVRDGLPLTPEQLAGLSDDDRAKALDDLVDASGGDGGLGGYVDSTALSGTYRDGFDSYFPRRSG